MLAFLLFQTACANWMRRDPPFSDPAEPVDECFKPLARIGCVATPHQRIEAIGRFEFQTACANWMRRDSYQTARVGLHGCRVSNRLRELDASRLFDGTTVAPLQNWFQTACANWMRRDLVNGTLQGKGSQGFKPLARGLLESLTHYALEQLV